MSNQELEERLSRISTQWSLVADAHRDTQDTEVADAKARAQQTLMERYHRAAYRYLLAVVRNPDVAEDLFQEFAVKFLRGDFRRADPERGRFRDFLKTSLINLSKDHYRKQKKKRQEVPDEDIAQTAAARDPDELGRQFDQSWREELLARSWAALKLHEDERGQPYYTVLRFRVDHPDMNSDELAERLTEVLEPEKPLTSAGVRKTVQRARERLADLLLDEVAGYVDSDDADELEEEIVAVELLSYCKTALDRRRG